MNLSSQPELAVVVPAWNERENLELLIPALRETLAALKVAAEIVVVDGGSTDGTAHAAEKRGARVVRQVERGYGGALLAGFAATQARYLVTMDADLSHRPSFLEDFWKRRDEADILIASRYVQGGRAEMTVLRQALSRLLNRVYRRVLSLPVHDLSSGFRLYHRRALNDIQVAARDFDVLEELLIKLHAEGYRIQEVPFHYMVRGAGRSHVRFVKFAWAFLKTLIRMWRLRNSIHAADYDCRAHDSPIWFQRYWRRTRQRVIFGYLGRPQEVLDIGCGSSRILLDLPRVLGLDIRLNKLRWLRHKGSRVTNGHALNLPFRNGSFSSVISSSVIHHVPESARLFDEMARVLRPGGVLIIGTPDYGRMLWRMVEWLYRTVHPGGYAQEHITQYTSATLIRRLEASGFQILTHAYVGFCELIIKASKPA